MDDVNKQYYRRATSAAIGMLVALLVSIYYSFSHEGWLVLAAFCATQTTRGTPLKQSLYIAFIMILSIIFSNMLIANLISGILLYAMTAFIFVVTAMVVYYNRPLHEHTFIYYVLFSLVLMIATLMPHVNTVLLSDQIIDVAMGALIAVISRLIIDPVRPYKDLGVGLTPILNAFESYSIALCDYLLTDSNALSHKRESIELTLQSSGKLYPEWIFEPGYNPGLRSGYRYFMINIERISELVFSMDYLISANIKLHMPQQMRAYFGEAIKHNGDLLRILSSKLNGQDVDYSSADYIEDINLLEAELKRELPGGLELLNYTQESLQTINFARDIKDMRTLLMQMLLSLP